MHLLTVVNKHHPGLDLWKRSAEKVGLVPTILWAPSSSKIGHESTWFGQKFVTLNNHLQTLHEDDLCLVTDGFDVMFLENPEEDIKRIGAPLLFAAELYENPDKGWPYKGDHRFKYLNAGIYAGTVKEIRLALKRALSLDDVLRLDDQRYFTQYYFSSGRIVLDHDARVFACLAGTDYFVGPKVLHFQGFYKNTKPVCAFVDAELCLLASKLHRVPTVLTPLWDVITTLGAIYSRLYAFPIGLALVLLLVICIIYETNASRRNI